MLQGPGIVPLEDLDQDMYELWQQFDLIGTKFFNVVTEAPPNVIMYYTLHMDAVRSASNQPNLDKEGNDNVSE